MPKYRFTKAMNEQWLSGEKGRIMELSEIKAGIVNDREPGLLVLVNPSESTTETKVDKMLKTQDGIKK